MKRYGSAEEIVTDRLCVKAMPFLRFLYHRHSSLPSKASNILTQVS